MTDQNKKTLRSFQCRDYLWEIFEQMSGELECSVDYLINEAMRQYARSRNYGVRSPSSPSAGRPSAPPQSSGSGGGIPSIGRGSGRPSIPSAPPPPPSRGPAPPPYPTAAGFGAPPQAGPPQQQYPSHPPPQQQRGSSYPPSHGGYSGSAAPPPLPRAPQHPAPPAPAAAARQVLYIIFNGQKIPIAKDEFVIGRGSKTADLPIKDGNISRRHAAVVFQSGAYYMKDLGSTNGIEYMGRRIDSKRIDEGDIFQICDYELRFTYH